ncbi:ethanolamine utilization protein EutH [Parendozoicomonas haliclonae]|uniref:Ethanolamine utilization protein, EutH n=1 Tax=Parendozoicomonas haliclonae TaxID=1960125 RepID=A0A1X7AM21_9GAMM|nr:ethanolamine utilization protein EutH [Parendozoicomonas haliclonae]SMA48877.1 Ethanolamine utilization protein, EutH [Parendozoicomonas haliclonae]
MSLNDIILYIMVGFMVLGAIDKAMGNKFGYGEKFEEGFMAMGALALAMIGVICLAPVLNTVLTPVLAPLYQAVGADPAMFAGTLLANDMGGYPLAQQMTQDASIANFSGLILGAMMGPTVVFTIPVALGIIEKEDTQYLARGVLIGLTTIPVGALVGGLVAGLPVGTILVNLVPVIIVAAAISLGLKLAPAKMISGFEVFGKGVVIIITLALAAAVVEALTGIVVIPGMAPFSDGVSTVGHIAMVLAGAFPLVHFITNKFNKPLLALGRSMGMGETAAAGLVATLANSIAMFNILKDMDNRGKIINVAFAVSASFALGDHLGYTAAVNSEMISAMLAGKLVGGITALILAIFLTKNMAEEKPVAGKAAHA